MEGNILEKFMRKSRWYVRLKSPVNGKSVMPQYIYVWLMGNPAFEEVPRGYAIHHLDGDKLNDDISNLALMQRYHHMAYHFKHKAVESKINISLSEQYCGATDFNPRSRPCVCFSKKNGRYFVKIKESVEGRDKFTRVGGFNGKVFNERSDAERFVSLIWDNAA